MAEIGERAQFRDRADGSARAQRFAETIFAVAIGARGVEFGDAGVGSAPYKAKRRLARRLSGAVGRAIGQPQLHRPQHKFCRARLGHAWTPLAPSEAVMPW